MVASVELPTGKVLLAAASNRSFGDQLVGLLLDRVNLLDIVNPLLVEAAGNDTFGLELILLLQYLARSTSLRRLWREVLGKDRCGR